MLKTPIEEAKKNAGTKAAQLITSGMLVGIGTGTTVLYFIEELGKRCREGSLTIRAVSSSEQTLHLAEEEEIPLLPINEISSVDITVDGADEIDPLKQMIKGGGGALLREKILAHMSHEMVVIIDETKLVTQLGKRNLPVEMIPFGSQATVHQLENMGYRGTWRRDQKHSYLITDNGNYIFDIHFEKLRENPQEDHRAIVHLPGVVNTGFFFNLAGRVIVGFLDGQVVIR
jgi:ribose 5-phosphate isomerase A